MQTKLLRASNRFIFWVSLVFLGFLTTVSLLSTRYFTTDTIWLEHTLVRMDHILINGICLAAIAAILYVLNQRGILQGIPTRFLLGISIVFVIVLSIIWVYISCANPDADQEVVSLIAWQAAKDSFAFFRPGSYMQMYPNQIGIVAVLELLYRIVKEESWKTYMYLNAGMNGLVVFLLYQITHRIFENKKMDRIILILSMLCVQLMFYSTFVYGFTIGLVCALTAVDFLLLFLKKEKGIYAILAGIFIGLSILMKNNFSIWLVAMGILILYKALERRSLKPLLALFFMVVFTGILSYGLTSLYEQRSGYEIGKGMPKSLWMAMGMQEGIRAEGWYNDFNFDTYLAADGDYEISDAAGKAAIRESLQSFAKDPGYALRFYFKKTVSQWNEPTYECIWISRLHYGELSTIVQSIYEGKLNRILLEYMNFYQQLIFAGAFLALIFRRRTISMEQLLFPLIILGGFAFHTLWEAKSQYILTYFICMLPIAAAGLNDLADWMFKNKGRKKQDEKTFIPTN